jgi:hypothetical protein
MTIDRASLISFVAAPLEPATRGCRVLSSQQHCRRGLLPPGSQPEGRRPNTQVVVREVQEVDRSSLDPLLLAKGMGKFYTIVSYRLMNAEH